MRLLVEVQNKLSRSKHKSLFPRLFTKTPNLTTKHAQTRARINKNKKMLPVLKAPSSKQNRKQHTQHSNPHTHNKRQHKSEIKIFFLLLGWRLTLARSCVVKRSLLKGLLRSLTKKSFESLRIIAMALRLRRALKRKVAL